MAKKISFLIFIISFALIFVHSDVYAINTQLEPSFIIKGGKFPDQTVFVANTQCSDHSGKIGQKNGQDVCNFCPDQRYALTTDQSSGQDICQLNFTGPNQDGSCPNGFTQKTTDQFGKDICVNTGAGATQTEIGAGQNVSNYNLSVQIPCREFGNGTCPNASSGIAEYVARLYQFSLMIVGLLALGGLVYGALKYTLSAGNIVSQQDAKDQIFAAIYGILILLGAYLILYTINPELVNLRNPGAAVITVPQQTGTTAGTPGTEQNVLTPAPVSSGQRPASPGANYLTQTGCARNSNQYVVMINGQDYWFCFAAANGYKNVNGIVSPQ